MKIKDLIEHEDFDYIDLRLTLPDHLTEELKGTPEDVPRNPDGSVDYSDMSVSIFADSCKSEDGKFSSMSGDSWSAEEEVVAYERWSNKRTGIMNGLSVVIPGRWMDRGQMDAKEETDMCEEHDS